MYHVVVSLHSHLLTLVTRPFMVMTSGVTMTINRDLLQISGSNIIKYY